MEFPFRIDDTNYVTFRVKCRAPSLGNGASDLPEVVAIVKSDEKLSELSFDEVVSIAAQILEEIEDGRPAAPSQPVGFSREDWLSGKYD